MSGVLTALHYVFVFFHQKHVCVPFLRLCWVNVVLAVVADHLSSSSQAHKDGILQKLLCEKNEVYEYDLIVIGGGSGGLACSKVRASQTVHLKPSITPGLHLFKY